MAKPIGRLSQSRSIAAAILAGLIILSALHAAGPHDRSGGPCVACQTLTAPALVPPAEASGCPPKPRRLVPVPRSETSSDAAGGRLRPLRAPPRKPAA